VKRREFITLLAGATAAWPLAARAQQSERMRRIGVLMGWPESDPEARSERAAFIQELQKLGWTDGRNLRTDTRWANPADPESMHRLAKELVALQPELILFAKHSRHCGAAAANAHNPRHFCDCCRSDW
jgi:putative tryptophan/tyrosine transport system substrate-binding protein